MYALCQDPEEERGAPVFEAEREAETPVAPDNPFDDAGPDVEVDFEPEVAFETGVPYEPTTTQSQRIGNDVAYEPEPSVAYEPTPAVPYEPSAAVSFEAPPAAAPAYEADRSRDLPATSFYETSPAARPMPSQTFAQNGVPAEPLYEASRTEVSPLTSAEPMTVATSGRASSDGQPLSARIEHDVISPSSSRRYTPSALNEVYIQGCTCNPKGLP